MSKIGDAINTVASGIGSYAQPVVSGLGNYATSIGQGLEPLGQGIQALSPWASLGQGIYGMYQQNQLANQFREPWKIQTQALPYQVENVAENVEGVLGPNVGGAMPQAFARGVAAGVGDIQAQNLRTYLDSLQQAAAMGQQPGSLADLIKNITGGGSPISTSTGLGGDPFGAILGAMGPDTGGLGAAGLDPTGAMSSLWETGMFAGL